jgi:hypothetical protein
MFTAEFADNSHKVADGFREKRDFANDQRLTTNDE